MRKKLYWWLLQLDKIGGTEMVSTALMNQLVEDYDITIICSSTITHNVYEIDDRINIISLEIPHDVLTMDQSLNYYMQKHQIGKYFKTINNAIKYTLFKRKEIQKYVEELIVKDDAILICSAIDSYWFAPKKGRVFFHFHFPENVYSSGINNYVMKHTRIPDKVIFITNDTKQRVVLKNPKLKDKAIFISNPCRFPNQLIVKNPKHNLFFLGRFSKEKNPMFALRIAKELHDRNFDFTLTFCGHGSQGKKMAKFIKANHLENHVFIKGVTYDVQGELAKYDLVLLTSLYEGFGLTIVEANSMSLPVISSNSGEGVRSVIDEGMNGYIIDGWNEKDYANKIIEILSDDEKYKELRKTSYLHNHKYVITSIALSWKQILK